MEQKLKPLGWKSTMNAPLDFEEEERIVMAWYALRSAWSGVTALPEPVLMLEACRDLITKVWEVRRAIDDAWYYANKRAFPSPRAIQRPPRDPLAGMSPADIDALLGDVVKAIKEGKI